MLRRTGKSQAQTILRDKQDNKILSIENHNGALAIFLHDDTYTLSAEVRDKLEQVNMVLIDEIGDIR